MNKIPLPSLSTDGWVRDSVSLADYLMSHFFLSEYSQTSLYPGSVSSLPYIIFQYKHDPFNASKTIQSTLEKYFSRYFQAVTIEAQYRDDPDDERKSIVDIHITFTDSDNKTFSFAREAEFINSKFINIVKINNGI